MAAASITALVFMLCRRRHNMKEKLMSEKLCIPLTRYSQEGALLVSDQIGW